MNFEYTVKKSKGRNIRISVNREGIVTLHIPSFTPHFVAKRFLLSKIEWVEKTIEKIKKLPIKSTGRKTKRQRRSEYLAKKEEARLLVHSKLEYWKKIYYDNFQIHFKWNSVSIKNTTTRWGSCSSKKNLNFSFRILELTDDAQDYLIVHELSHLLQMNHSKNFWNLVALGIPNYKVLRKSLRKYNIG